MAAMIVLTGCATASLTSAPGVTGSVYATAPRQSTFSFIGAPLAEAEAFAPWSQHLNAERKTASAIDACLADRAACDSVPLVKFRRMMELAAKLPPREQMSLVHHYFNETSWTSEGSDLLARDVWEPLYHVASTAKGDCEDIAFAKYHALRRLGWAADDLRVIVGWDAVEKDWHAVAAVRMNGETFMLDSILGLQKPKDFRHVRMIYSVSEAGVWDHAPHYAPVPKRAARFAAMEANQERGGK
jgi:predicted transglutaminase-like cysteine proteinase